MRKIDRGKTLMLCVAKFTPKGMSVRDDLNHAIQIALAV